MTPAQCRAARTLVDMTQADLAKVSMVPQTLILDFEFGIWVPNTDVEALKAALEGAGVEFVEFGGNAGVRLRK